MIPDPALQVYQLYGVESSWLGYVMAGLRMGTMFDAMFRKRFMPGKMEGVLALLPADFLIDESLTVRDAFYGKDISDHMPFDRIDAFLG